MFKDHRDKLDLKVSLDPKELVVPKVPKVLLDLKELDLKDPQVHKELLVSKDHKDQ